MQTLPRAFSRTFDGHVWQVLADAGHNLLVAEIRHPNRTVSFAALDLRDRQWLWHGFTPPETWWSSAVLLRSGILFVQAFAESQNPDPRGITAIDIATRRICWSNPDMQFVRAVGGGKILAKRKTDDGDSYLVVEEQTGLVSYETPAASAPPTDRIGFPVHYPQSSPHFAGIASFLSRILGISPGLAFDYAEFKHYVVISYYIRDDKQVLNSLVVIDTRSRLPILHETLATGRTGIGQDTFFIFDNLLVFVQEQTSILCYELQ